MRRSALIFDQVCHQLLKPLTSRSKRSLCEDLIAAGSTGVGRASVVLSHSWSSLFDDSVDAAIEAVEDGSVSNQVRVSSAGCGGWQRHLLCNSNSNSHST
jgi:hypothetical protein